MHKLKTVQLQDGPKVRNAIIAHGLPHTEAKLKELVAILMGEDPRSPQLLLPVTNPESVPATMGAKQCMYLTLTRVPGGGFGKGGIYAVYNWVEGELDPAMPDGWGAAITQPALFTNDLVPSGESVHMVVLSPMKKVGTEHIIGMAVMDPHWEECPPLEPIHKAK